MGKKKQTLSLSMIVKNEEKHLPRVLENAHIFCDEIIILDTGSSDRSVEIAHSFNATVKHFEWCDDFAKARNASLEYCTGDFVIWLDADDIISVESALLLRQLFSQKIKWDVLYLPYYYNYHPEKPGRGKRKTPPRVFRNNIGVKWTSPIHEHLLYPKSIKRKRGLDKVTIYHAPLRRSDSNALRNLRIMYKAAGEPENITNDYHYWHIAKEYSGLGNTREAIKYFKKALRYCSPFKYLRRSRQYHSLASNYKRAGHYKAALEYYSRCALSYSEWREPYFGISDCLASLGDYSTAAAYLELTRKIPRHQEHVDRAELYEGDIVDKRLLEYRAASSKLQKDGVEETNREGEVFSLVAGGDLCLGRQLPGYITSKGTRRPFTDVSEILNRGNVVLANLECVISNTGTLSNKGGKRPFHYRAHPIVIKALVKAGFNVLTTANNHSMDYGIDALNEQNEILNACHITHPGSGRTPEEAALPAFVQVDNIIIAVISIDTESSSQRFHKKNGGINHCKGRLDIEKRLALSIAYAKRYAHLVIVSPHWGNNWKENPSAETRELAHRIIDYGADAILGHSAHIVQGIEVYNERPVIYDMGSILFDRVQQNRMRFSALFEVRFNRNQFVELIIHPVKLGSGKVMKPGVDRVFIEDFIVSLSKELSPSIEFTRNEGNLSLQFPARRKYFSPGKKPEPEQIYHKSQIHEPSRHYLERPNVCVFDNLPTDITVRSKVVMSNGIIFHGAQACEKVRTGMGFVVRVYFSVDDKMKGRWEGRLIAKNTDGNTVFTYTHPVSEGALPPQLWVPGEIILDETVVRPPVDLPDGNYKLLWVLIERNSKTISYPLDPVSPDEADGIFIGNLVVTSEAPRGVAGLAWN